MAQENIVQEGVERVRDAVSSIESDLQRAQRRVEKEVNSRRKSFEKELKAQRKRFEKQTQKQIKQLRKTAVVKRAETFVDDAQKQFEQTVDSVLEVFQIASRRDVKRLDRKLNQINKKLKDLEKNKAKAKPAVPTAAA
jgi:hypothetical protein